MRDGNLPTAARRATSKAATLRHPDDHRVPDQLGNFSFPREGRDGVEDFFFEPARR